MMDFLIQKAYAYEAISPTGIGGSSTFDILFKKIIDNVVSPIIYLIAALAVVYFVWGVMKFIGNANDTTKRQEGYQHMIWGIVGLFIMVSVKGIIYLILRVIGL
ncbi:MAG: hypothetical protein WC933_00655 [Candidatus Paceibacterota bacterium]|jgi:uncharacterized membrane protein YidH (DUF202 family)